MAQMVRGQGGEGGDEMQGHCPTPISPSIVRSQIQEEDHNHSSKKSILTKVKEKAKKLRSTLSKKKHDDVTSPGSVNLEEKEEENPEYHGAPMYESELAPEDYKVTAKQNPAALPVITERNVLEPRVIQEEIPNANKTLTETVTGMLAPAYAMVSEATHVITSKIQGPPVAAGATGSESSSEHKSDKGVSMKEYLKQKLEPGEDEKALSQVISEAMSPKEVGHNSEMGMVDKVKEAVSSLILKEEQPKIPVSTYPREVEVEGTHERRLQTN